jgi:hypothetical protein
LPHSHQRWYIPVSAAALALVAIGVLYAQKPFKQWPALEYGDFPIPPNGEQPAEWTRARLRYPDIYGYPNRVMVDFGPRGFPGYWTMDYPRSDRHALQVVKRLTRIDARPLEQVITLDGTDEAYNWPMVYAVEVGYWALPPDQAKQLLEYLLRGGFLMVDDFHSQREWNNFMNSMSLVFPDKNWEEIPNDDPIFHVLYDLNDRTQVPGYQFVQTGRLYEKDESGRPEHWRAIYDDKRRVMVAICFNMDLGDAVEHSDDPEYPEKFASLAYRIYLNYFIYDLTH